VGLKISESDLKVTDDHPVGEGQDMDPSSLCS